MKDDIGPKYFNQVSDLIEQVSGSVSTEVHTIGGGTGNLERVTAAVKRKLSLASWRTKFAAEDKNAGEDFDSSVDALIKYSFLEILGR